MTRLAGPRGFAIRFVIGVERTRAVVTGVFPPEDAPARRPCADRLAEVVQPTVRAWFEEFSREWMHRLLYGEPGPLTPQGILNLAGPPPTRGKSYFESLLAK